MDDLQGAVETIRGKSIQVPEAVYQTFKTSIAKRRKVTEWFTSVEFATSGNPSNSTAKHIHFTEKLQEAFSILFQDRKEALLPDFPLHIDKVSDQVISTHTDNRFAILSDLSEETDEFQSAASSSIARQDISQRTYENSPSSFDQVLQDDPMEALIEIHLLLRELDSLCQTIKCFWEQASDKILPLLVAAWLTNAAYQRTKSLCDGIKDIDKDAQEHQEVYIGLVNQLRIVFSSSPTDPEYDDFTQGRGMTFPWIAIAHFKIEWIENRKSLSGTGRQDPVKLISPISKFGQDVPDDDAEVLAANLNAYKLLLSSIAEQSLKEDNHVGGTGFVPSDMNPLLSDLSAFLKEDNPHPNLQLVFGVHLLLEIAKSFTWKNKVATAINCRLQALHFARDVKALVQMRMLPTNDPMVARMRNEDTEYLDKYLAGKCFDLYFQSPWTAGFHMCEILHHSMDAGLRLCNSQGNVGAVLHMYNALRQISFMDAVPLLDDLCEVFSQELCLGSLPTTNFSSKFRRFLGGTTQSEPNSLSGDSRQSRRRIGLPLSLPTAQDYVKRFMPGEISMFYDLHNNGFRTTIDFWSNLYTGKPASFLSKKQQDVIMNDLNNVAFTELLAKMRSAVLREFTGQGPVASIQYSAIFALCQQILREMAILKCQEADKDIALATTQSGFIFVDTLLVAIVEHQRDTQMSKLLPHLSSLHLARQAILEFCDGTQLAEFSLEY
ncbi:uncharacterized protein RAG0_12557 [Rhynchosporium agropyri]|uniref:DUF6604 domain-containing protein n=1 Tax=Rhynchosporium agropyri TaxID=914238 RepID=A0A1E1L8Z7_9HELO|nr:uncharacterized protein RAG0_12557 [Rhynchosporium agropyri]